jgi:formate hydrogenlyase transcriptional activator
MTQQDTILPTELEEQLQFEMLLTEISARFINLPAEQVESEIQDAQRRICESLHFDRSTIWQISEPNRSDDPLTHRYQYQEQAGAPIPERIATKESFPWTMEKILRGEVITISKMADLPPEATRDCESYRLYGTKSTAVIPLMAGGVVLGQMAFATLGEERDWPRMLVKRLQVIAQVFANAIARKRADQALRESEARLSLAAASAGAGLWILDVASGHFWTTEKTRELFGVASEEEMTFDRLINLIHPEDRERIRRATDQAMKSSVVTRAEFRIVLPDGTIRWMVSLGRSYCSSSAEPESLMGVSIDITTRKETERSLQKAYEEIKQLKDRLEAENIYLRKTVAAKNIYEHITGQSVPLKKVLSRVEQVAPTDAVVLITGETGTGKELIAEAIHNQSKRKGRLLVKVNCASLPAALMENELFGREKGAYTGALAKQIGRFELADHSTLFLDEITELPLDVQAKLLRVLQNGEFERLGSPKTIRVDVRLMAASNRDIVKEVQKGAFRKDLYYRLNVFTIEVPPLRERPDDIPLLVDAFVREFSGKMGKRIRIIPKKSMEALQGYQWPGNIRELRNVIEHGVIISSGNTLQLPILQGLDDAPANEVTLAVAEHQHITGVLKTTGWRIKGPRGAAAILGIKPSNLYAKMKRLGIPTHREKDTMMT